MAAYRGRSTWTLGDSRMTTLHRLAASGLIAAILVACAPSASDSTPHGKNAALLATTLGSLHLSDPTVDLDANLKRGDVRFVGVYGFSCVAPGVEEEAATSRYGINCLAGTSDAIESTEHAALIQRARDYAERYNSELQRRRRAGLIT